MKATRMEEAQATAFDDQDRRQEMAVYSSPGALVLDNDSMSSMMALAEFMSKGVATVPKHLQKNAADCLAVIMQAVQWRMNPFAVAQKTHLVGGVLGYEAQLVNAVVTSQGPTTGRINYEWFGEWQRIMGRFKEVESKSKVDPDTGKPVKYRVPDWRIEDEKGLGIRVWATMKGEAEPRVLELHLNQCRVRNSPLWADDPRQQIAYLAVKRWSRLHCPDVILGVYTKDELEEQYQPERIVPKDTDLLPEYPDEQFQKNLPAYVRAIEAGKKTADDIIGTISTKYTVTDDQIAALREIAPPPPANQSSEGGDA